VHGQVNLALVAFLLYFFATLSQVKSGIAVGVAAGFKLTPSIAGLYFLATRQFKAAVISIAAFLSTVLVGWLALPKETWHYWTVIFTDSDWIAPAGQALNQSMRGAMSRTLGYDVKQSGLWLLAAVIVVVLALLSLRNAVRAGDRLAMLISVHLLALLLTPISWDHHWVWAVPVLMWLRQTTSLSRRAVIVNSVLWWVMTMSWVVIILNWLQVSPRFIERTWYLMWLGWAYPLCAIVSLATMATARRITSTYSPEPRFVD
jgi:alpha-1,2-mannosyltransferase